MSAKKVKKLSPPAVIGIVGGGQLGRMIAFEAKRMGYKVIILDPKPCSPAGQVSDEQIVAGYSDLSALRELAKKADVITYEFEHIDAELLGVLEQEGYAVYPSAASLKLIQNKYTQKMMLKKIGVGIPEFCLVKTFAELQEAFQSFEHKIILKSCTHGYDGKGNIIIKGEKQLEEGYAFFGGQELLVEEYVNFSKEVSILVAKNGAETVYYPVAENTHQDSILIKSLIPAKITAETEKQIREVSEKILEELDDIGLFCIEFFVTDAGEVLVNEIAPRPHNSGHYTIEACIASQFEQLVRIVCGMPFGSTELEMPAAMYNLLGSDTVQGEYTIEGLEDFLRIPHCYFHLYGKEETSPLRKIGHITALAESVELAESKAEKALQKIEIRPRVNN